MTERTIPRPKIYISGPLTSSGNVNQNIDRAIKAARQLIEAGFAPLVPHLSFCVDPGGDYAREVWMQVDLAWLEAADAVLLLPGESVGADIEVKYAREFRIRVFTSVAALVSWFSGKTFAGKASA